MYLDSILTMRLWYINSPVMCERSACVCACVDVCLSVEVGPRTCSLCVCMCMDIGVREEGGGLRGVMLKQKLKAVWGRGRGCFR